LGIGPNPQSPIPNPQSPLKSLKIPYDLNYIIVNAKIKFIINIINVFPR
jgi:hypothetical protein